MRNFKIYIANVDVTDLVVDNITTLRSSSEFPFFSDTATGRLSFTLFDDTGMFSPLNANNFFSTNHPRTHTDWNPVGYKAPVRVEEGGVVVFEGYVVEVHPNPNTSTARIAVNDLSIDLRESEIETEDFGQHRFVALNDDDLQSGGEPVYRLPESASPVFPKSVSAELDSQANGTYAALNRVDTLKSEGIASRLDYVFHSGSPALELAYEQPENARIGTEFYEPYRWTRIETLVKNVLANVDDTLRHTIEVPLWRTESPEFATRGRVGWHVEGGATIRDTQRWRWTGFVRDFIVDPKTGDAYFLYGSWQRFPSLIHYDYASDTYTRHFYTAGNIRTSFWRIATADFEKFWILSAVSPNVEEFGGGYNTSTALTYTNAEKPRLLKWTKTTGAFADTGIDSTSIAPPQLANMFGKLEGDPQESHNRYADTRRMFEAHAISDTQHRLFYEYQDTNGAGVASFDTIGESIVAQRASAESVSPVGAEHAVDIDNSYIYEINVVAASDGTRSMKLSRKDLGAGGYTELASHDAPEGEEWINVSDIVVRHTDSDTEVYGVLQFERTGSGRYPGGKLIRMRSGTGWGYDIMKSYDFYLNAAKGGVVHKGRVFYFEGSRFQHLDSSPNTRTGHLIEASNGRIVDHGVVWRSDLQVFNPDTGTFDSGVHNAIIAPLRSDGDRLHILCGYGNIVRAVNDQNPESGAYYGPEEPVNSIENWHWITWGHEHPLYLQRFEVSGTEKVWNILKRLAEICYSTIGFELDSSRTTAPYFRFYFRPRESIYSYLNGAITDTDLTATVLDASRFPQNSLLLIGSELMQCSSVSGNTLTISGRGVQETKAVAHADGDAVYVVNLTTMNYTPDSEMMAVDVSSEYSEIHNQIRGQINWTIPNIAPGLDEDRPVPSDNAESVAIVGPKPLEIDMQLLTHHEYWWAKQLADRYQNELSRLNYDIRLTQVWNKAFRIREVVVIDVRRPEFAGTQLDWKATGITYLPAQAVSVEHTAGTDQEQAWTTEVVCRTFNLLPSFGTTDTGEQEPIQTDDPELGDTTEQVDFDKPAWTGITFAGDIGLLLSDSANAIYVYDDGNSVYGHFNLPDGTWLDIDATSSHIYLLDGTDLIKKIKQIAYTSIADLIDTDVMPTDLIELDTASDTEFGMNLNTWLAIASDDTVPAAEQRVYALGMITNDSDPPDPDYIVRSYELDGTLVPEEETNLYLKANYTGMVVAGGTQIFVLVGNSNLVLNYTKASESNMHSAVLNLSEGSARWIGIGYNTSGMISGGLHIISARASRTRWVSVTGGGGNSQRDRSLV